MSKTKRRLKKPMDPVRNLVMQEILERAKQSDNYRAYISQIKEQLRKEMDIHKVTLDEKLNNKQQFKVNELVIAARILDVSLESLVDTPEAAF